MSIKPLITKVLTRKYQFALHPAAVELIEDIFQEHEFGPDDAQNALELIAKECQKQEGTRRWRVSRLLAPLMMLVRLRYQHYHHSGHDRTRLRSRQ